MNLQLIEFWQMRYRFVPTFFFTDLSSYLTKDTVWQIFKNKSFVESSHYLKNKSTFQFVYVIVRYKYYFLSCYFFLFSNLSLLIKSISKTISTIIRRTYVMIPLVEWQFLKTVFIFVTNNHFHCLIILNKITAISEKLYKFKRIPIDLGILIPKSLSGPRGTERLNPSFVMYWNVPVLPIIRTCFARIVWTNI